MVDDNDHIKLIDFGIASDSSARRLTYANFTATLGTPNYISPEQVKGKRGDGRSDIYSMGVILYELLTGKLPFTGPTPIAAMNDRLLNHPMPPTIADPSVSPQLQEVLYRALERDPAIATRMPTLFSTICSIWTRSASKIARSCRNWQRRKSQLSRKILYYGALAMVPVAVLLLMILIAHHHWYRNALRQICRESSRVPYASGPTISLSSFTFHPKRRSMTKYKLEYIWLDGKKAHS